MTSLRITGTSRSCTALLHRSLQRHVTDYLHLHCCISLTFVTIKHILNKQKYEYKAFPAVADAVNMRIAQSNLLSALSCQKLYIKFYYDLKDFNTRTCSQSNQNIKTSYFFNIKSSKISYLAFRLKYASIRRCSIVACCIVRCLHNSTQLL